jgi:hypothetical protein
MGQADLTGLFGLSRFNPRHHAPLAKTSAIVAAVLMKNAG